MTPLWEKHRVFFLFLRIPEPPAGTVQEEVDVAGGGEAQDFAELPHAGLTVRICFKEPGEHLAVFGEHFARCFRAAQERRRQIPHEFLIIGSLGEVGQGGDEVHVLHLGHGFVVGIRVRDEGAEVHGLEEASGQVHGVIVRVFPRDDGHGKLRGTVGAGPEERMRANDTARPDPLHLVHGAEPSRK